MSFADELNSKVNEYNNRPTNSELHQTYLDKKIDSYVREIEYICREKAEKGQRRTTGFFQPYYEDFERTVQSDIIEVPIEIRNKKPTLEKYNFDTARRCVGGAMRVRYAALFGNQTDAEYVRSGIIRRMSNYGFKRFEIQIVDGPIYNYKKVLGIYQIYVDTTKLFYYVDIEW